MQLLGKTNPARILDFAKVWLEKARYLTRATEMLQVLLTVVSGNSLSLLLDCITLSLFPVAVVYTRLLGPPKDTKTNDQITGQILNHQMVRAEVSKK